MYHDPDSEGYYSDFEDDDNPGGTGDQDPVMADPPAGFIPRMYLEQITEELTDEECDELIETGQVQIWDEDGMRALTREEIRHTTKRVTGVRDTRTGKEIPQRSDVRFMSFRIGDM